MLAMGFPPRPNPLSDYIMWLGTNIGPFDYQNLMQRDTLTKWLYAVFFKTTLPTDRSKLEWMVMIFSPWNLTIFFCLLWRLHEVGYPAHWLWTILANILDNTVITSARPALSAPLTIDEGNRHNPVKKISTAPYIPEISTLTTIFQPMLPFSVITSSVPSPNGIYQYTYSSPPNESTTKTPISQNTPSFSSTKRPFRRRSERASRTL